MPSAPKHQCGRLGCRQLTDRKFCQQCEPQQQTASHRWDTDRRPVERVRGRKLQALRLALFRREPLCRRCGERGRVTLAAVRDHIVPLAEGGADDESNIQPLCNECSDMKTREESKRGRVRQTG